MAEGGGVVQEKLAFFLMELSLSSAQELEEQRGISGNWHSRVTQVSQQMRTHVHKQ